MLMKVVKWVVGIVLVLFLGFIAITYFLPKEYSVVRTTTIQASPETVYNEVSDLEKWQEWNPWNKADPNIKITYGEKTQGAGASYAWESQSMGDGEMRIIATDPPSQVQYALIFEGYEDQPNYSEFSIESANESSSKVTWSFEGSVGDTFFGRWFSLLIEKQVGPSYEEGLEALKNRLEE